MTSEHGPRARHPVHDVLAGHAAAGGGRVVADLGCGAGGTLAAVAERMPGAVLLGVDLSAERLAVARSVLAGHAAVLVRADLGRPLPLPDRTVDVVVCHNVIELLVEPGAFLAQVCRVLRPSGRAVLSHTDFAGVVVHGAGPDLTDRILYAYASVPQPWMSHVDPYAARRLPGLARRLGLVVDAIDGHTVASAHLSGQARRRISEVAEVVRGHARNGRADLSIEDVDLWWARLVAADRAGEFTFAETALITLARRPPYL